MLVKLTPAPVHDALGRVLGRPWPLPDEGRRVAAEGTGMKVSDHPAKNKASETGLSPGALTEEGAPGMWPDTVSVHLSLQDWPYVACLTPLPWPQDTGDPPGQSKQESEMPGCPEDRLCLGPTGPPRHQPRDFWPGLATVPS